ncbi:MAG: helix-turn-helix domain-containing protein [Lachnospiraceae bacterium]|nr:helix-turn-helix domain-containing protein [Lachnospiraceae bacterium]
MYITQGVSNRIKTRAKEINVTLKVVLSDAGLGINIVSQLAKGTEISAFNLAKIADRLDCSVDYLLGRTDNPNSHNIPADSSENSSNDQISAIIGICKQLNAVDLAKVLIYADEIRKGG